MLQCLLSTERVAFLLYCSMPSVPSDGKILVSGVNGFVATWIVQELLERGYSVRGTVRSESKATFSRSLFAKYGDRFEIAIVPDITVVSVNVDSKVPSSKHWRSLALKFTAEYGDCPRRLVHSMPPSKASMAYCIPHRHSSSLRTTRTVSNI